jgi:DNA-binding phage protein
LGGCLLNLTAKDVLKNPVVLEFLGMDEKSVYTELLFAAIGDIAESRSMTEIAKELKLNRESLYNTKKLAPASCRRDKPCSANPSAPALL